MTAETDLYLDDGRTLRVYDTGPPDAALAVFCTTARRTPARCRSRCSAPQPNGASGGIPRTIGRAMAARRRSPDAISRRSLPTRPRLPTPSAWARSPSWGTLGGGPHALACTALLPGRVLGAAAISGPAPFRAEGLDWFAGMVPSGQAQMCAAAAGRTAYEKYLQTAGYDPEMFTPADHAALAAQWAWLPASPRGHRGRPGRHGEGRTGHDHPLGFGVDQISEPVLIVHGGQDRTVPASHGAWLAQHCRAAELWMRPDDRHVSVLVSSAVPALDWLVSQAHGR